MLNTNKNRSSTGFYCFDQKFSTLSISRFDYTYIYGALKTNKLLTEMQVQRIVKDSRDIDITKINHIGFIRPDILEKAITQLAEVKRIVDELLSINEKITLPHPVRSVINSFDNQILDFVNQMETVQSKDSAIVAKQKDKVLTDIKGFYNKCFHQLPEHSNRLLENYAIAKSFVKPEKTEDLEAINLKADLSARTKEATRLIDTLKDNTIVKDLENTKTQADTILKEIKKATSKQTVSNYAIVFGEQADEHKGLAEKWLTAGIIISVIFIILIIVGAIYNFLPTERLDGNIVTGYNITNIITKALIIAVIIFIISFSFKQYSVNRHLQALNTQRQKALNSYKLFTTSISKDDTNSHNALMIQVAKAIYEPQSTGFLNEKGQQVNSGIIELTKMVGQNGAG